MSYTEYSNREMLGTLYYKCLSEVESMRAMTRTFNADKVVKNLYGFMGSSPKEYLLVSIGNETIENDEAYIKNKCSAEGRKQDCELKAFKRLAEKIKKAFPRLAVCIVADSLYVSENVMELCGKNNWKYMIRYKEGSAKSIEEEYCAISEKEKSENIEYVNDIVYKSGTVNMLVQKEIQIRNKKEKSIIFKWITKKNAVKLAVAGRLRWKIENQGFNHQKRWQGNLEHECTGTEEPLPDVADCRLYAQLYEYFYLKKQEIEKVQKNIPSDILKSFGELTKSEDIFTGTVKTVLN